MTEKIGLVGELNLSSWSANVSRYLSDVDRMNRANKDIGRAAASSFGNIGSMASSAIAPVGGLASAMGNMAQIAGGIVAAQVLNRITEGIGAFFKTGLDAVSSAQQLETSLKSLLTANNMYAQSTETVTSAITKQLMTQDEYTQRQAELTAKLNTQRATYQEQEERIRQLTLQYGENGLVVLKTKAQHEQLAVAIRGTEQDLANLTTTETKYEQSTKTTWKTVMDMASAQKLAGKQTQELIDFVSKLAVASPFATEAVEEVTKSAVQAGIGVEQIKKFIPAFMDLGAATGMTSTSLAETAYQLFQVKKQAHIGVIDLRQLATRGLDLAKVIGTQLGMSVDEFNEKAKKSPEVWDQLFDAVSRFSESTFKGSSAALTTSVKGLASTLSDIGTIGAREFWRPIVDAVSPTVNALIGKLSELVLGGRMEEIGKQAAELVTQGLGKLSSLAEKFKKYGPGGLFAALGFEGGALFFKKLSKLFEVLTGDVSGLGDTFKTGLGGAFDWLQQNLFPMLSAGVGHVTNFITTIKDLYAAFQAGGLFGSRSGSFGGEGLLAAMGVSPEVAGAAENFINQIGSIFQQVQAGEGGSLLQNWAGQLVAGIPGALNTLLAGISTWLNENWPTISATLDTWADKFWGWTATAASGVGTALGAVTLAVATWALSSEGQAQMAVAGNALGKALVDYLSLQVSSGENIANVFTQLSTGLMAGIAVAAGSLVVIGGQIVAGLISGMAEKFGLELKPWTINQLREFYGWFYTEVDWGAVGKGIMTRIKDGIISMADAVAQPWKDGVEAWQKIVKETEWAELGKSIIDGFLKGINDNVGKVYEKLKSMMKDAWQAGADAIGFGSPAAEYIRLGQSMTQGLVVGLNNEIPNFRDAFDRLFGIDRSVVSLENSVEKALRNVKHSVDDNLSKSKTAWLTRSIRNIWNAHSEEILAATDRVKKFREIFLRSYRFGDVDIGGSQVGHALRGLDLFIRQFEAHRKEAQQSLQAMLIQGGRRAIELAGQLNELGQSAVDRINTRVDALANLLNTGASQFNFEGKIISATEAQELFNQAMRDQLNIQDDIAQMQQNQARLGFLQKQLDLLETVQKAGLNTSDIFGGLKLGLNASLPDLVEATNRVVTAMINQANQDLQIASPSRVFARIGQQVMAGMGQGIMRAQDMVTGAVSNTVSAIASPVAIQPALVGAGGGGSPTFNFYIGSITSRADVDYFSERVERIVAEKL